jgi:hypothetical protein
MGTAFLRQRIVRWLLSLAVVTVATLGTALGTAAPARADSAFTLSAMAEGVSVVISNATIPLIQSVQVNTPMASTMLNSRGQGSSYSAAPDPGQDVAELPATGSAEMCAILEAYGAKLPGCAIVAKQVPAYPYAYAQSGDAPQDRDFAGAHMHAEATDSSSEAQTVVGASGAGSAVSTARSAAAGDGSTATSAVTSVDSLQMGTYVELSGIHAVAAANRGLDGRLSLSSSFQIGHLTVDGLDVGYEDGSFVLLGRGIPAPVPTQQVFASLKSAGITATFLPATKTTTGITSEGLMLSYTIPGAPSGIVPPIPLPLPIGVGVPTTPTTITYVLGRAQVASTNQAIGGFNFGGLPGVLGGVAPPLTGTSGGTTPLTATAPLSTPNVASPQSGTTAPPAVAVARRGAWTSDSADVYLAFVVAALAMFGGVSVLRFLGVRLSWTS